MELASGSTFSVSTSVRGGYGARWSQDGGEIYYTATDGDAILATQVTLDPFSASEPVEVVNVDRRFRTNFDVTADGQRFLVAQSPDSAGNASPRVRVILNWFEELKQRVPTGR